MLALPSSAPALPSAWNPSLCSYTCFEGAREYTDSMNILRPPEQGPAGSPVFPCAWQRLASWGPHVRLLNGGEEGQMVGGKDFSPNPSFSQHSG